jgi:hypothetical protein
MVFKNVRDDYEVDTATGKFIKPVVKRLNGYLKSSKTPMSSAMFMAFPYTSLDDVHCGGVNEGRATHPTRGLWQSDEDNRSTKSLDKTQVYTKLGASYKNKAVHVAQLWAVVVNNDTLITYGQMTMEELRADSIEVHGPPALSSSNGPSTIRFRDEMRRVFFFPVDKCKTWFEFMATVRQSNANAFDPYRYPLTEGNNLSFDGKFCDFYTDDLEEISSKEWPAYLKSATASTINVYMKTKDTIEILERPRPISNSPDRPRPASPISIEGSDSVISDSENGSDSDSGWESGDSLCIPHRLTGKDYKNTYYPYDEVRRNLAKDKVVKEKKKKTDDESSLPDIRHPFFAWPVATLEEAKAAGESPELYTHDKATKWSSAETEPRGSILKDVHNIIASDRKRFRFETRDVHRTKATEGSVYLAAPEGSLAAVEAVLKGSEGLDTIPESPTTEDVEASTDFINLNRRGSTIDGIKPTKGKSSPDTRALKNKKKLVTNAKTLLSFFVPLDYDCEISRKYWSAIETLVCLPFMVPCDHQANNK